MVGSGRCSELSGPAGLIVTALLMNIHVDVLGVNGIKSLRSCVWWRTMEGVVRKSVLTWKWVQPRCEEGTISGKRKKT